MKNFILFLKKKNKLSSFKRFFQHEYYDKKYFRNKFCGEIEGKEINNDVKLCGWIEKIRKVGEDLVFLVLKDKTGSIQIKLTKNDLNKINIQDFKPESVIFVNGKVSLRPDDMINNQMKSGNLEIEDIKDIKLINQAKTLPLQINKSVFF
jgi:aspartyl-tRNA synthetase